MLQRPVMKNGMTGCLLCDVHKGQIYVYIKDRKIKKYFSVSFHSRAQCAGFHNEGIWCTG